MKIFLPIILLFSLVAPAKADTKMRCTQLIDTGLMYQSWETPKRWASVEFDDSYDKVFYLFLTEAKNVLGLSFGQDDDHRYFKCNQRRKAIECMSETGFIETPDYGTTHLFYLSNDLKRFQYIIPSEQAYLEGDMGNVRVAIGDCEKY